MAPNAMICSGSCIIGQSLKWRQLGKVGKCQGREAMGMTMCHEKSLFFSLLNGSGTFGDIMLIGIVLLGIFYSL